MRGEITFYFFSSTSRGSAWPLHFIFASYAYVTAQERARLTGEATGRNGNTARRALGVHTDSNAARFITSNAAGIAGNATGFMYGGVPQHVGNAARAPLSGSAAVAGPGNSFSPFFPNPTSWWGGSG